MTSMSNTDPSNDRVKAHRHDRVAAGGLPDADPSSDPPGDGNDAFDGPIISGPFGANAFMTSGDGAFPPFRHSTATHAGSSPNASSLTTTTAAVAPVAVKATSVASPVGYTAGTNTQWNMKALFGADPNAVLKQYDGQGVHIADYDNGIDLTNTALDSGYDASRQISIGGVLSDPTKGTGDHGTATAGIMVADASTNGGTDTGLAYGAKLTAVDVSSGVASTNMVAAAKAMAGFDVTNNSWGWTSGWADPTNVSGSFGQQFLAGIKSAADTGRAGLGTVVVKAAGNDWGTKTNANESEFSADRHVTLVGAVWSTGDVATYSDRGSDLLVSSYGSIETTDKSGAAGYAAGNYVSIDGTSAAAPEVTATVADMMSANAKLGWRDVQDILADTATDTETAAFTTAATGNMAFGWTVNGANTVNGGGLHYSDDVGFGTENAAAAIREAEVWSWFTPTAQTSANEQHLSVASAPNQALTSKAVDTFTMNVASNIDVESASLTLKLTETNLNHLTVELDSPDGTKSILLSPSNAAQSANGFTWSLESEAFRGELSAGNWTVKVSDPIATDTGTISNATLDLYGSTVPAANVFHYTDEALKMDANSATRITLNDAKGVGDWIDTAATTGNETLDLHTGNTSDVNGTRFAAIGAGTTVNDATLGSGTDIVMLNDNGGEVVGGHGVDTFLGGKGNDMLIAGWAGGTMTGGAGANTFAFGHDGVGNWTITDFSGQDHIDLRGLGDGFSKLTFANSGTSLVVSGFDASGDKLTLAGLAGPSMTAGNFVFA